MIRTRHVNALFVLMFVLTAAFALPCEAQQQSGRQKNAAEGRLSAKSWDLWRTGFEESESGEAALIAGRNEEAAEHYKRALSAFKTVKKNNPNWNKNVINYRISLTEKRMNTALRRIEFQRTGSHEIKQTPGAQAGNNIPHTPSDPQAEIAALRAALKEAEEKNAPLQRDAEQGRLASGQVNGLLNEKKELEAKYNTLLVQYDALKKQADSTTSGNSELQKAYKEEQFRAEALKRIVDDLKKDMEKMQNDLNAKKREIRDAQDKVETAEKAIESAKRAEKNLASVRKDYSDLQNAVIKQREKTDKTIADLSAALKDKIDECTRIEATLKDLRNKTAPAETVKKLEREAKELREDKKRMADKYGELEEDLRTLNSKLATLANKEAAANKMISSLNAQNKALTAENEAMSKKNSDLDKALVEARAKLDSLTQANKKMKDEMALLAERVNKIPAQQNAAVESVKLKKELEIKKLEEEKKALSEKIIQLEKAIAEEKAKPPVKVNVENPVNAELQAKVKAQDSEIAALKKAIAEEKAKPPVKVNVENPVNAELQAKIKAQDSEIAALKKAIAEEKAKPPVKVNVENPVNAELQAKIKAQDTEIQGLKKALAQAKENHPEAAKAAANTELQAKIKAQDTEIQGLKKALADEKAKPPVEVKVENPANTELQAKVKAQDTEIKELKKALAQAKEKSTEKVENPVNTELQAKVKALEEENKSIKESAEKSKAESDEELRKLQLSLNEKIRELKESSETVSADIKAARQEKAQLQEENRKLSRDLLSTQALLEKAKLELQDTSKLDAATNERNAWKTKYDENAAILEQQKKELIREKATNETLKQDKEKLSAECTALKKRAERAETKLAGWEKGASTVSMEDYKKKVEVIDNLLKQRKTLLEEQSLNQQKLSEMNAQLIRYRNTLQLARDVTEKAMEESRRLRADLLMYRRKDPNPRPEVPQLVSSVPDELKELTAAENNRQQRERDVNSDKYTKCMEEGAKLLKEGKMDDALWQFWAASDAAPGQAEPYIEITKIHALRNNPEQGIKSYEKALRLGAKRIPDLEKKLKQQLAEKQKKAKRY